MAGKNSNKADTDRTLRVTEKPGKSPERSMADTAIDPAVNAAITVLNFAKGSFGSLGATETFQALNDNVKAVKAGNLSGPEAILAAQAHALNAMFTELARRSAANMGEYLEASDKYMRMALKAQAQCRATIETLAALKNPPVVIARQANISAGHQQVNNGVAAPRAEVSTNSPNELLEQGNEQRLDPRAARAPGTSDPSVVALEAGNGP